MKLQVSKKSFDFSKHLQFSFMQSENGQGDGKCKSLSKRVCQRAVRPPSEEQIIIKDSQRGKQKRAISKQQAPPTGRGGACPESQWEAWPYPGKEGGLPEGGARVLWSRSHVL